MKSLSEHIKHTSLFYSDTIIRRSIEKNIPLDDIIGGKLIHSWTDYSVRNEGIQHRENRHDLNETLPKIKKYFGPIYGEQLTEDIYRDHISADISSVKKHANRRNDKMKVTISGDLWMKIEHLRRSSDEKRPDVIREAIILLEKQRRLENDV